MALWFLMYLVAFGGSIDCDKRAPVVYFFALAAAMASGFIGGSAALKGNVPVPWAKEHPLGFAAGGGLFVLLLVMAIGSVTYGDTENCIPQHVQRNVFNATVVGRVFDSENAPLHDVIVTADVYHMVVSPDAEGWFSGTLSGVRAGDTATFVFSAAEHEAVRKSLVLPGGLVDLGEIPLPRRR